MIVRDAWLITQSIIVTLEQTGTPSIPELMGDPSVQIVIANGVLSYFFILEKKSGRLTKMAKSQILNNKKNALFNFPEYCFEKAIHLYYSYWKEMIQTVLNQNTVQS